MKLATHSARVCAMAAALALGPSVATAAPLLVNGGFETGTFAGWTVVNQANGSGDWFIQSGTASPLNLFGVQAPPEGTFAAMTDQGGPGSHILYQDFVVPTSLSSAVLSYELFILNQAGAFFAPGSLDFNVAPNQQARIDIITTTADPFSVAAGDVLLNLYQSMPGDPLTSGYTLGSHDLTAFLQGHLGETLRLRFAEADNQLFFAMGVDYISLDATAAPEPATLALLGLGMAAALRRRRVR